MSRLSDWADRRKLEKQRKRKPEQFGKQARAEKISGQHCRYPGCYSYDVEYHHIVHRGKMGRSSELSRPENAMPLCHTHHQQHHTTIHRVPFSVLLPDEVAFVVLHAGREWLEKWYPTRSGA